MVKVVLLHWSGYIVRENSDASLLARWELVQSESDSGVTHVKVKVVLLNQSGCIESKIWRTILNGKSGECSTRVVALSKKILVHPSLQVGRLAKVTAGRWLLTDRMQLFLHCCYQEKLIFSRYNANLILTLFSFANSLKWLKTKLGVGCWVFLVIFGDCW